MNKVIIYYGSKEKFNQIIPKEYRNLTDLVYESDKDGKIMKLVIPTQSGEYPKEEKEEKIFYEILYLIFNYPHKHYTFKHFEV